MPRAQWTFRLFDTPLNRGYNGGGNGLITELTLASSRSMSFNLTDPDSLSFSMPLRDPRTALVQVMSTDVVAICNGQAVQRFRVKARSRAKQGDQVSASFTCVSYKAVVGTWIVHEPTYDATTHVSTGNRVDWPIASSTVDPTSDAQRYPSAVIWKIVSDGQSFSGAANIGLTQGNVPTGETALTGLDGTDGGTNATGHFLTPGMTRLEAVQKIAELAGYEWSIDPDPSDVTKLKLNVWKANGRTQFTGTGIDGYSDLVLESGSTIADWSESEDPSSWANVARVSGLDVTKTDTTGAQAVAYRPSGGIPDQVDYGTGARWPAEGAVERDIQANNTTPTAISKLADAEAAKALDYTPDYSVTLAGGRWPGPDALWVGDRTKVRIHDVQLNSVLRVVNIGVSLDSNGTETVSMGFTRNPTTNYTRYRRSLEQRLRSLERRT